MEDALKEICPDVEIVARQAGDTLEGGMKKLWNPYWRRRLI